MKKLLILFAAIMATAIMTTPTLAFTNSISHDDLISVAGRIALTGEHYKAELPNGEPDEIFFFADGHEIKRFNNTLFITYEMTVWEIPLKLRYPYDIGMFDPFPAGIPRDFAFIAEDGHGWFLIMGIKTFIRCGEFNEDAKLQRSGEHVLLGGAGRYQPVEYITSANGWQVSKSGTWLYTIDPQQNVYVISKTAFSNGAFGADGYLFWIEENRQLRRTSNLTSFNRGEFVTSGVSAMVTWPGEDNNFYITGFLRTGDEGSIHWLKDIGLLTDINNKINDLDVIGETEDDYAERIFVTIDGERLIFPDQQPTNIDGMVYVPLAAVFNALGAQVNWNEDTQTATAIRGNVLITLTVGEMMAHRNNRTIQLEAAPVIIGGRTMVPVRFISEALGVFVYWDEEENTVVIEN